MLTPNVSPAGKQRTRWRVLPAWAYLFLVVVYLAPPFAHWRAERPSGPASVMGLVYLGVAASMLASLGLGASAVLGRRSRTSFENAVWPALWIGFWLEAAEKIVHVRTWAEYVVLVCPAGALLAAVVTMERREDGRATQERLLQETRSEVLNLKLAPHFLFNTLNTLKAQIETDPHAAGATTDRLAQLLRELLGRAGRRTISLREELAFVEAYLGIERIRLGNRLRVEVKVPERLESAQIPPLSLQVLVENAVKHGVAPREEGGEIRIWARSERWGARENVWIGVESPAAEAPQPGAGVGLETLRSRLRTPHDLRLTAENGRFRAVFSWAWDPEPARG